MSFLFLSANSFAANSSSTTKSTATLSSSCQIFGSDVSFGNYDPNSNQHLEATQLISFKCTKGTSISILTYPNPNITPIYFTGLGWSHPMQNANTTDQLYYQVYTNSIGWNGALNFDGIAYKTTANGTMQNTTFSYRVIKNQYVKPLNYSTSQTVVINF